MSSMEFQDVSVSFSDAVGPMDKRTAAKLLTYVSSFWLNESRIVDVTVDEQGRDLIVVRWPSAAVAQDFIDAVSYSESNAEATLKLSAAAEHKGDMRRQKSEKAAKSKPGKTATRSIDKLPTSGQVQTDLSEPTRFRVHVLFESEVSRTAVVAVIQQRSRLSGRQVENFGLSASTIELDAVDEAAVAYGAFIRCPDRNMATRLIDSLNRTSKGVSAFASLVDCSADDFSVVKFLNKLNQRVEECIKEHQSKCSDVASKVEQVTDEMTSAHGRGRNTFVPFTEFERKKAMIEPLNDKLKELRSQRLEFDTQLADFKMKVDPQNVVGKTRSELMRIGIDFEREMDKFSSALPMYARKSEIVEVVRREQVSVIVGETGSGKSTQILQYLFSASLHDDGRSIVCTQPRKVAAISLARRVAEEMRTTVGELVGYKVGMQAEQSDRTRLLYVTDHVLLNDCLKDPLFASYSCIVIDEAHERSIYTDLLLGFVKQALRRRSDLRVVIMSATIDPDLFVSYFDDPVAGNRVPVLRISGRAFPVDVVYASAANDDYVTEAAMKALEVHQTEPPGDILVFLTSPIETEQACKKLKKHPQCDDGVQLLELHGRLQIEDQQKIFDPTPAGKRKIVFATNSAETSITIPGVKYVIDSGKVREVNYDPKKNMSQLNVQWVTRSSAEQRKGRAGRTDCGKCFRLYSKEHYDEMRPDSVPEILRVHLGQALLKLMMLGISDVTQFDFVQSPDKDAIIGAMAVLKELGACDDQGVITDSGKKLSKLSLEPRLGKLALRGIDEGISFESVVMAAVSTVGGSIFFRAGSDEQKLQADRRKTKFCDEWGDIITLVNVYREWDKLLDNDHHRNGWCREHAVNAKSMGIAKSMIKEICYTFKQELNVNIECQFSADVEANEKMAAILFDCYSSNLSRYCGHRQEGYCLAESPETVLHVHPSSALNYVEEWPQWVVHEKILTTSRPFMLNATFVKESWVVEKINSGKLKISMDRVNEVVLRPHAATPVGGGFIGCLLQNRAQPKKNLETAMKSEGKHAKAVIDIFRADGCSGGIVTLYSTMCIRQRADQRLADELLRKKSELLNETVEEPLLPNSSVRFILERGAQIRTILMPNESRVLKVRRVNSLDDDAGADAAALTNVLSRFGEIESIQRVDPTTGVWGFVRFKLPEQAQAALASGCNLPRNFDVELHHVEVKLQQVDATKQWRPRQSSDFTVKVVAQRRPLRGFGYVCFSNVNDVSRAASHGRFVVSRSFGDGLLTAAVSIQTDKKNPLQCYLRSVPTWANEEIIKSCLKATVGFDAQTAKINLSRAQAPSQAESVRSYDAFVTCVSSVLLEDGQLAAEDFQVINTPSKSEKDFEMRTLVQFSDPNKARAAAERLSRAVFEQCLLNAFVELKVSFAIPKSVYDLSEQLINRELNMLKTAVNEKLSIDSEARGNSGAVIIKLSASHLDHLILAKRRLSSLLNGCLLHLEDHQFRCLNSPVGQRLLKSFADETKANVRLDERQGAAYIHCLCDQVEELERLLMDKLKATAGGVKKNFSLKSSNYPRGMMKALVVAYGPDLEKLRQECGATFLDLVIRQHAVCFQGSSEACDTLERLLGELANGLPQQQRNEATEHSLPDCPVCLMEVAKDSFHVMEYCGHMYCKECAANLVENAIRSNDIPIRCAADNCAELVLQDVRNIHGRQLQRICDTAVRTFVQRRGDAYKNCITPNCRMIYRRTPPNEEGQKFECSECQTSLCTSCNVPYHHGLSCSAFQRMKTPEFDTKRWLNEDPDNRSLCPKCGSGIEKNGGCQHMECTACKIHICWRCKNKFNTSGECYQHLRSEHGGYS